MSTDPDIVLHCDNLNKSYAQGSEAIQVLHGVQLEIRRGERLAIVGASGSGKSTLLNLLGGLDAPDSGEVRILGQSLDAMDDKSLSQMRNRTLGFVYQFHHLLPEFSALENILMPLMIARKSKDQALAKAKHLLDAVNLSARAGHKPSELSGGERQRIAIARALANDPACVLMDEPTGNLDSVATAGIEALMHHLAEQFNTAFVVVTHDEQVARGMDSIYRLEDGRLEQQIG